jgi:hypothetical protein
MGNDIREIEKGYFTGIDMNSHSEKKNKENK